MMKTIRVLITAIGSASGINALMALRMLGTKTKITIIGIDANPLSAGLKLADKGFVVPKISEEDKYFKTVYEIIEEEDIDACLPVFSKEIPIFARRKTEFMKKTGIPLCIPSIDILNKVNDKYLFYQFLKEISVLTPKTMTLPKNKDLLFREFGFPFVIKKRIGAGARSIWFIHNESEVDLFYNSKDLQTSDSEATGLSEFIAQQFLSGKEYTIDFCCDFGGKLLGAVIRERLEVRDGKTTKGRTIYDESILREIERIFEKIKFTGPGNIQGFLTESPKKEFLMTELNPRFAAGGLPLTVEAGFNIPAIIVKLIANPKIEIGQFKQYTPGKIMLRYYDQVFIDDETQKSWELED